jgi:hypothetical protein
LVLRAMIFYNFTIFSADHLSSEQRTVWHLDLFFYQKKILKLIPVTVNIFTVSKGDNNKQIKLSTGNNCKINRYIQY